jgi:integrase
LAPLSKGHLRSLMHKLFDLATLWEYLPLERRNPIEIVKIKNVTRRTKDAVVLSPDQFREVVRRLPAHVNMIAITMSCLGLRVSEALACDGRTLIGSIRPSPSAAAPIVVPLMKPRPHHQRRNCL